MFNFTKISDYFFGAKQVPHAEFLDLLRKKYYAIIERKIADTELQNQMEINFHTLQTTNIELFIKDICEYADKNDIHIILNLEMVEKTYTTAEMNILQRYGFVENKQAKSIFRRPRPNYWIIA